MRVYLAFAVAFAASGLFLGILGLRGKTRKRARRLFFALCASMAWFVFCAGWSVSEADRERMELWYRLSSIGFAPFFAFNLHFYIRFAFEPKEERLVYLIYLPVPFIIYSTMFSSSLYDSFTWVNGFWKFSPAYSSPWFWLYLVYFFSYTAASILIVLFYGRRSKTGRRRKQCVYIAVFASLTLAIGSTLDFHLTSFPSFPLPPIGPLVTSVYTLGLWFVLLKYGFLDAFSDVALDQIIENVSGLVFLLDSSRVVVRSNCPLGRLAGTAASGVIGTYFPRLTTKPAATEALFRNLCRNGTMSLNDVIAFETGRGPLYADTTVSKILEAGREIDGYLLISREMKDRRDFLESYGITEREAEIIGLGLSGRTNAEIASELGIALRTVETHLANVYNKCGVNNKIELFGLAEKHGFFPNSKPST